MATRVKKTPLAPWEEEDNAVPPAPWETEEKDQIPPPPWEVKAKAKAVIPLAPWEEKAPEIPLQEPENESPAIGRSDSIPQRAVSAIKRMADLFTPESLDPSISNILDIARAPADIKSIDTPAIRRGAGSFASGAAGSVAGMAGSLPAAVQAVGAKDTVAGKMVSGAGQTAYDSLMKFAKEVAPKDPNFGDQVIQGAGSMATFLAPGLGTARLAAAIPRMAVLGVKLGPAIGATISTGLEAATEAGQVYQDVLSEKESPEEAVKAASKDFFSNVLLIGITNKFGIFNDKIRGAVKKHLLGSSLEALQEGGQEILGSVSQGKDINWDNVVQATGVGAVIGGGASAVASQVLPASETKNEGLKTEQTPPMAEPKLEVLGLPKAAPITAKKVEMKPDEDIVPEPGPSDSIDDIRPMQVEFMEAPNVPIKDKLFKATPDPVTTKQVDEFFAREEASEIQKKDKAVEDTAKEIENIRSESDALGLLESDYKKNPQSPIFSKDFVKKRTEQLKADLKTFVESRIPKNQQERFLAMLKVSNNPQSFKRVIDQVEKSASEINLVPQTETTKRTIERTSGLSPVREQIQVREDQALKSQILAEARGARVGYSAGMKEGKQLTKEEMMQRFREGRQQISDTVEFIKNSLPVAERGKFIAAASKATNLKRHYSIFARVVEEKEKIAKREAAAEIKDLAKPSDKIPVDYQRKLEELVSGFDLRRLTPDNMKRLLSLRDYISQHGEPLGINQKKIEALKRLSKKNIKDMSVLELNALRDELQSLQNSGRLKLELKYKYNYRVRQKDLNKLTDSTISIDPDVSGSENMARAKAQALNYYINTMHTMRVADMLDGYQGYKGENVKHLRELANREDQSVIRHRNKMAEFMERAVKIKPEWTQEEMDAMAYHIYLEQKSYEQVQALIHSKGFTQPPKLTTEMRKMIDLFREIADKNSDQIAAVYEETQNKPFQKVKNYFPLKYEKEFTLVSPETLEQDRYRTTKTFRGFTYGRKPGVKKAPRTDLFNILDEALSEQEWYINMQPKLENLKYLVKSEEYKAAAGEVGSNFWANVLDVVSRRGWSATAQSNFLLRQGRLNLQKAILGYKLSSILMQPLAIIDATAYTSAAHGPKMAAEVLKEFSRSWVNPKRRNEFIAQSPALQARGGGDESIIETFEHAKQSGKYFRVYTQKGMKFIQKADLLTAAGVERGVYNALVKNGTPVKQAIEESEFIMNLVSGSNNVVYRPLILSKGEGARTVFTFQNFFLNKWGLIAHDMIEGRVVQGDYKKKMAGMIGLAILMAGSVAEQEARRNIYQLTTGKKLKQDSAFAEALMTVPFNIPFFGKFAEAGYAYANGSVRSTYPPIVKIFEDGVKGGFQMALAKKKSKKKKGALKFAESALTLGLGIPGTSQGFDVLERMLDL